MPTVIGLTLSIVTAQAIAASNWHYDEDSDTVAFSYTGNSETRPALRAENESVDKSDTWYYDENSDYIVYNVNDTRDHSAQTIVSINSLGSDTTPAFLAQ
jgi:hypothetical protein